MVDVLPLLRKDITSGWDKNKAVVQLFYADGVWYAVTQQRDKSPGQAFIAAGDWPQDKIAEYMKSKKYITCLAFEPKARALSHLILSLIVGFPQKDENWAIIFSPLDGGMKLATTEDWPNEKFKEIPNLFCYGKRD